MANKKKVLLLVDDDNDFLQSNKRLLELAGYEVHTANTGESGIAQAKTIRPNLMILDVMMASHTEGFKVNQEVRNIPELKDMPVIMLTGINKKTDGSHRFGVENDWPCVAFLDKPVLPEELLAKVREYTS